MAGTARLSEVFRWVSFAAWAVTGGILALGPIGAATVGLYLLPIGVLLVLVLIWRGHWGPQVSGLISGVGLMAILIGVLNLDYVPCPPSGSEIVIGSAQASTRCGGTPPLPWLASGVMVFSVGLLVHALLRARSPVEVQE